MKQYLLLVLNIILSLYAVGQEDALIIKEATKINRRLIPGPVMDSLHQLFPKAMPIEYYSMSPASANGVLIMTKLKENVTVLPGTVQESMKGIRKDYPGFKVRSADCYKNEDRARQLYYEVIAERGNNQQRFFYDEGGTLVKIDIIRRETN